MADMKIDVAPVVNNILVNVKVTGASKAAFRVGLASSLMKLAAKVGGFKDIKVTFNE